MTNAVNIAALGSPMSADSNGNVGIGTTTPSNKLTLNSGFVQVGNGVGGGGGVHFPYSSDSLGRTWRARTDITGYGDFGFEQSTTQTGTAYATRLLISQAGQVTKPYQPAFKVVRGDAGGNVTADEIIPFSYAILNNGSHFNLSTYTFTAPVAGNYLLSYGGMNSQGNSGASLFRLYVNGVQKSYFHIVNSHPSSSSYTYVQYMNSGDTSYVRGNFYHFGNGPSGYDYPYFSGFLLG